MSIISFSLFEFERNADKLWAFSQMGLAKPAIRALPDLEFFKLMGTGSGAGFSTRPNFSVYTLLAQWPSLDTAVHSIENAAILRKYRIRSARMATFYLETVTCRGSWDGHRFLDDPCVHNLQIMPIIALTRARLRIRTMLKFWSLVPAISKRAEDDGHRQFMIGTGEVPLLNQVTFSIWDSGQAMQAFAHESATHGEAVRRAYTEGWFSEYFFARFNVRRFDGQWPGIDASAFNREIAPHGDDRQAVNA